MRDERRIRVYLLLDHEVVRRGVAGLLAGHADMELVGQAATAASGLAEILELRPDVAVLDAHLPDGSGIDVCREVRSVDPGIRGLILAGDDDEAAVSASILAGASGFVLERIEGASLVSGIRLVASGHSLIDPTVAARVVEQVVRHRRSLDALAELTPQQRRILFLIADGLTNRQIAERLYLAEKTVKNHVTALLAKLGVAHRTQAALLAVRLEGGARPIGAHAAARPVRQTVGGGQPRSRA